VRGLAFDAERGKVFFGFADASGKGIKRMNPDATEIETIIDDLSAAPVALALDTTNDRLYFAAQENSGYYITQSDLEGGRRAGVAGYALMPTDLAVDAEANRLYVSNSQRITYTALRAGSSGTEFYASGANTLALLYAPPQPATPTRVPATAVPGGVVGTLFWGNGLDAIRIVGTDGNNQRLFGRAIYNLRRAVRSSARCRLCQ
jgi:hypothetical protein